MSFIEFESGREKEKARQELREVRAELLRRAEENAKRRDAKELEKKFRGEDQWMLPSLSEKLDKMSSISGTSTSTYKKSKSKSKKSKKFSKKEKKEKKKKKNKRHSSNDHSSSTEEKISKKKHKKRKHFSDAESTSSLSSESEDGDDEWVEKKVETLTVPLQRDDWMSGMSLATFSKDKSEKMKKIDERKHIDSYDPSKNMRELNPYWKDGGQGLPSFKKPTMDSDDETNIPTTSRNERRDVQRKSNWRKKNDRCEPTTSKSFENKRMPSPSSSSDDRSLSSEPEKIEKTKISNATELSISDFLTDQQMNELGAKIVKAEIMGNDELVAELQGKIFRAREYRKNHKDEVLAKSFERRTESHKGRRNENDEGILLTTTNGKGMSRPVSLASNESEKWGGRSSRKAKKLKIETHLDGERINYFADDSKYDIKQLFEREKFSTSADQDMQFANIAGKHKNPNDDLEDIFADKVRKKIDDKDLNRIECDRAINEQKQMAKTLDACDKCFDSTKLKKQFIIAMGRTVYLALPQHEGLRTGHCIIAPLAHVSCATQLDEDVWSEILDFMKAIDRMFTARKQDVIFFESAGYLHRKPHMVIQCVPGDFEMAPFYFKKAIQEAEGDWTTNKQLISLKDRDVRRAVPKSLPYFWVNFGIHSGFAHVIEDQDHFPMNFAQEVIGGLLNLDARLWRRPRYIENPIPKVKQFADWWKPYDCTRDN